MNPFLEPVGELSYKDKARHKAERRPYLGQHSWTHGREGALKGGFKDLLDLARRRMK